MKQIKSLDELLVYAGAVANKSATYEPIELVGEDFALSARIDGNEWDQKIDVRLAKYVLLLQDSFDGLLEEYGDEEAFEEPLKVRLEVHKGSSIPWAKIVDQLQHLVTPMTPEMTFISVMTAIAAIGGYYFFSRYRDSADKKMEIEGEAAVLDKHEETKRQAIDALRTIAELNQTAFRGYEKPPAHLTRCLEEGDTIEFAGEPPLAAEVAKKMAPKKLPRTPSETTYADGSYLLKRINYTEGEPVLDLAQGPHEIKGYISQLSDEDAKALFDGIRMRELSGEKLPMTLAVQVNVSHTARNFKFGSIVGTGAPREDRQHKTLADIASGFK